MAEPLRIALDATSLYDTPTGVRRFAWEVLRVAAQRSDVAMSAYAITFRGRERLADLVPPGVSVAHRSLPMAAAPLRAAWRRADHPRIDRWIGPVDVVHGANFVVPPTDAAAVVTIHDLTYLHFPQMCQRDVLQYVDLVPRAIRRGALVHTVSEFVRQEVLERYEIDDGDRVVAVPNGVTPPPTGDPRAGQAAAGGERYITAIGTVEPRKDLPGLVAAFDLLAADDAELRLVIVGADGWGAEQLTASIDRSPHRDRIVRTGWVDDAARAGVLAGALALALPSRYEGFGLTAVEAMATGTPVVATAVGAIPEVVGEAAVLIPAGDVEALADALSSVTTSEGTRADLVARGRARAATFTWDRTVDGLSALWAVAAARS